VSSVRRKQLDLFGDSVQIAFSSRLPTATRKGGRRTISGGSSLRSSSDLHVAAILSAISGSSSSRSAAVPTTTFCSGSPQESESPSRTITGYGGTD
jgi:hypothetical protein